MSTKEKGRKKSSAVPLKTFMTSYRMKATVALSTWLALESLFGESYI